MQKKHFIQYLEEGNIGSSEQLNYPLPIIKNSYNMKHYTKAEIEARMNYNRRTADKLNSIFNSDIKEGALILQLKNVDDVPLKKISIIDKREIELLREFIQHLCEYHIAERIKYEIALQGPADASQ